MKVLTCAEVEDLGPELGLGVLPGDDRAAALAHVNACERCRRLIMELSDTADSLLTLAPPEEPPAGFAERVARNLSPRRRRRWRAALATAAAALLVGSVSGILPPPQPPSQVATVRTASFVPAPGERLNGHVFAHAADASWVFMTVNEEGSSETYGCELTLSGGSHLRIGEFQLKGGTGSWGKTVNVAVRDIQSVRLVREDGSTVATARLSG
jgi:hypothetical protein